MYEGPWDLTTPNWVDSTHNTNFTFHPQGPTAIELGSSRITVTAAGVPLPTNAAIHAYTALVQGGPLSLSGSNFIRAADRLFFGSPFKGSGSVFLQSWDLAKQVVLQTNSTHTGGTTLGNLQVHALADRPFGSNRTVVLDGTHKSGAAAVTRLDTVFRQGARSGIVTVAHGILHADTTPPTPVEDPAKLDFTQDIHFVRVDDPEACVAMVTKLCCDILPKALRFDPLRDIQVLAPMHKGTGGIQAFNQALQGRLRGADARPGRIQPGDKVIQTRNNYDKNVFNGDFGVVLGQNEEGTLLIDFDGARVELERGEQGDLHLAYAVSIHKSQGSEFPAVVVPLLRQHSIMLARNLVYTAVTRGRKQVILVGDPTAYAMAVRNASDSRRITGLLPRLRGEE